ncbi:MAG: amidase [Proteobacteria bacterium]|nr:amidase [Pseudomonadota bacterium]
MDKTELAFMSVANQARLIQSKEISPVDLVDAYLQRIEEWDPVLHAWIHVCGDQARDQARTAEREILNGDYRGPLHGIPFGVKDQMKTLGVPTTLASIIKDDFGSDEDATVVARLKGAGAVLLGKQNLHEFGKGGANSFHFGEPKNPWNPRHTPASSSSGSGVAPAAGLCSFSIGEDTGGSVRGPAWANGLAGIRPTFGRVSRYGGFMYAWTQDTFGPLTRTVEDNALVLRVIAGHDPKDPLTGTHPVPDYTESLTGDLKGLRIGVVRELGPDLEMHPDVAAAFKTVQEVLVSRGAVLKEISLPWSRFCVPLQMLTSDAEVASMLVNHWVRDHWDKIDDGIRTRVAAGALVPAVFYSRAMRARVVVRRQLLDAFQSCDALLALSHVVPPEPIEATRTTLSGPGDFVKKVAHERRMLAYPFNIANVPAMNVPCGFSGGLPMGFQVAAKPYDEATMYRVAHAYEQEMPWHTTHPDLAVTLAGAATGKEIEAAPKPTENSQGDGSASDTEIDIRNLARTIGLTIPDADLRTVELRFEALMKAMAEIESELGAEMDKVDPIPPVFPREDF